MGSFHSSKDDTWYHQSLRTAIGDLRQDLNIDHDSPYLQMEPSPNIVDAGRVMEDLERMAAASNENESTLSGLLQEVQVLATRPYANKSEAAEDIFRAFFLLDQLFQGHKEEDRLAKTNNDLLNLEFLNALVGKWKKCWKGSWVNELPPEETARLPTPWVLVDKLYNYQSLVVPDTTTYNHVLSVASQWKQQEEGDADGSFQLALFVQSVVDQMKLSEDI
jgi:hypothetical protein